MSLSKQKQLVWTLDQVQSEFHWSHQTLRLDLPKVPQWNQLCHSLWYKDPWGVFGSFWCAPNSSLPCWTRSEWRMSLWLVDKICRWISQMFCCQWNSVRGSSAWQSQAQEGWRGESSLRGNFDRWERARARSRHSRHSRHEQVLEFVYFVALVRPTLCFEFRVCFAFVMLVSQVLLSIEGMELVQHLLNAGGRRSKFDSSRDRNQPLAIAPGQWIKPETSERNADNTWQCNIYCHVVYKYTYVNYG